MIFGKKIRELRDEQGVLQRQLAALLEIDTPMFSKIERGDRRAKREHVIKLAEYLHQDEKEMLTLWLADKVLDAGGDDELSKDAITIAQEQDSKAMTAKRQFDVLTTANCRSVVKSLIVASLESIARGVIGWEHCGISASNYHL